MEWVCENIGHTIDVHKNYSRARSDVLERIEIAKILLIQDLGMVKDFVGTNIEDIQFEGRFLVHVTNMYSLIRLGVATSALVNFSHFAGTSPL